MCSLPIYLVEPPQPSWRAIPRCVRYHYHFLDGKVFYVYPFSKIEKRICYLVQVALRNSILLLDGLLIVLDF